MILRLRGFVVGNYPLTRYLPAALLWGLGLTALFLAGDGRAPGGQTETAWAPASWAAQAGLAVSVLTLFVDMLLLRALDDIRDLDYDRVHNPRRPLPSGVARINDLIVLVAAATALLLLLNAWRGAGGVVLAAHLGYAIALVTLNTRWRWPATENQVVQLAINAPVQLLLSCYVYAAFLSDRGLSAATSGGAAVAATFLATMHWEFARKTSRAPGPTERTYVHHLGVTGTVLAAQAVAGLSVICAVLATRPMALDSPAHGWGWMALAPLAIPAVAGYRFWYRRLPRWPAQAATGFIAASFVVFIVIGVLARSPV